MSKKPRIDEINIVRAIAIMGVLMVHATSSAVGQTVDSSLFPVYNFANIFFKFGTPTFILLSSFVLFYNYYDKPLDKTLIRSFYKKRLLYILLPYLIFSIGYFAYVHVAYYYPHRPLSVALSKFITALLTGKAYAHLYFVFISVQFYLLFPLLLILFKKMPKLAKYAILLGFAIQWGFVLLNKSLFLNYGWSVPNKGSWSLSYFAYYFTGAFLGIYFQQIKSWLILSRKHLFSAKGASWVLLWVLWLGFGLTHVWIWYQSRHNGIHYDSLWYEFLWNMHTFTTALVLIQLSFVIFRKVDTRPVRLLSHLGVMSFGVYLIHPFVLIAYREFPVTAAYWFHLWYAGGFIAALVISWIMVTLIFKYFPGAWVFFGNVPKRYQREPRKSGDSTVSVGQG